MQDIDVNELIEKMADDIESEILDDLDNDPLIIGIHSGGAWLANQLHEILDFDEPMGELNISFYRDDFSRIGMHPQVTPTNMPFEIEDRDIILVDDVLYTGRTIRAAMNEIFDYGRPANVYLAVLIERNGRELPIQADIVGKSLTLDPNEHVKLLSPEPLALEITRIDE